MLSLEDSPRNQSAQMGQLSGATAGPRVWGACLAAVCRVSCTGGRLGAPRWLGELTSRAWDGGPCFLVLLAGCRPSPWELLRSESQALHLPPSSSAPVSGPAAHVWLYSLLPAAGGCSEGLISRRVWGLPGPSPLELAQGQRLPVPRYTCRVPFAAVGTRAPSVVSSHVPSPGFGVDLEDLLEFCRGVLGVRPRCPVTRFVLAPH